MTGGAGYVGGHAVRYLCRKGLKLLVLDNFSTGHKQFLDDSFATVEGDIRDEKTLHSVFSNNEIDAVFHFAALSVVSESTKNPSIYRDVNVDGTRNLLNAMSSHGVRKIVFSSSAAVYGSPKSIPIKETDACRPVNPYGRTKLKVEQMLMQHEKKSGIRYATLRYFNAAGAGCGIGELHKPESHLIPIVLKTARSKRKRVKIFGIDYPTKDGTCIRDYVHVVDLAAAHYLAFKQLAKTSCTYNLGSGAGFSVKEVIKTCREVTGADIPSVDAPRREGDPAVLVASPDKIKKELGWKPKRGLREMVSSAWEWHNQRKPEDGH